ncbi:adenylate/guanylate cyclase domain-containing protein [Shimia haliotis]|uniref:Adenylate/guanylate cyclase n=1 Tax=Shimia haliotis TaxID=1280847 RepID=A0A1I4A0J3_9RHOB|nr:adenylate/guanylate cyclase domain-containing protein [Shimia haliotis]SFK49299.1 adenylate/guanylate cyclase [Shimia haliotis]
MIERLSDHLTNRPRLLFAVVALGVLMLPVAVWLDLNSLSHHNLHRQATSLNSLMDNVRDYYASNVVARVQNAEGRPQARHDYHEINGAYPIPATVAIELSDRFSKALRGVEYRFVSDHPFRGRPTDDISDFEQSALDMFRDPQNTRTRIMQDSGDLLDHRLILATPVRMQEACVACHNAHPDSPKTDWEVGDVRGLQVVNVQQPLSLNLSSFKFLLGYLLVAGAFGLTFAWHQLRLARQFRAANAELAENNSFLADVSLKISKYLEPQVYRSIFEGERDVAISTERKKLTVFFSDIKDFTATTERMQPEELTKLLNEYFSEMSRIAKEHGATIDKFIGDAIVAFFGDPSSHGPTEDARACVRMALAMQDRLDELEDVWRQNGFEHPFRARMGLNTGYCNVGNFGSETRMDYTIIGAEANLAARLESIAEPGGIVMSYETYAHARDLVEAEPLAPQRFKGISREITPYRVVRNPKTRAAISNHKDGDMLVVDLEGVDADTRDAITRAIERALAKT